MPGMPVLLKLAGRHAVIIGGGDGAAELAATLLGYGASVTVVALAASLPLHEIAASGRIELLAREYMRGDLSGASFAACFEAGETAAAVASEAHAERCLVTIAEHPELSTVSLAGSAGPPELTEESA